MKVLNNISISAIEPSVHTLWIDTSANEPVLKAFVWGKWQNVTEGEAVIAELAEKVMELASKVTAIENKTALEPVATATAMWNN